MSLRPEEIPPVPEETCRVAQAAFPRGNIYMRMRDELGRRFAEVHFEWVPYLYPDLDEGTSEADESAAIEAGTINATGFRYVGIRRALAEP